MNNFEVYFFDDLLGNHSKKVSSDKTSNANQKKSVKKEKSIQNQSDSPNFDDLFILRGDSL